MKVCQDCSSCPADVRYDHALARQRNPAARPARKTIAQRYAIAERARLRLIHDIVGCTPNAACCTQAIAAKVLSRRA